MAGRSIRIFLVDGSASGVRTAELGLSTIKAVVVPRASLSAVTGRRELQKTGVYVLVGADPQQTGRKKLYVGEGDTVLTRLLAHNVDPDKDFWEEAVVFVSKDENVTKAHVRYLEAKLIGLATAAKRATTANGTSPSDQGRLPEADEVEMGEFVDQARLLLGTLGYSFFEPSSTQADQTEINELPASTPEFGYSGEGFSATCRVDLGSGLIVVREGSQARRNEAPAMAPTYRNLRAELLASGVLERRDDRLVFMQDYAFTAPTAAAQVVSGQTVSGRQAWRHAATEETFGEWQERILSGVGNDRRTDS